MKRILTIWLFFISLLATGQQNIFYSPSANQKLIEDAVKNGIFLLRQDYQLKDTATGKYYGRGGNNMFGSVYAWGIKVKGGYYLSDRGVRPWRYDANFDEYRRTHVPVLYKTYRKEITDTTIITLQWDGEQMTELVPGKFGYVTDSLFQEEGFEADLTFGKKAGWLVWIIAEKAIEEAMPGTPVSYTIYRKELTIKKDVEEYPTNAPSTERKIWGGIYIVPEQTAVGQITFRLVGIMAQLDGQWTVFTPFRKIAALEESAPVYKGGNTLTPVEGDDSEGDVNDENAKKKNKK